MAKINISEIITDTRLPISGLILGLAICLTTSNPLYRLVGLIYSIIALLSITTDYDSYHRNVRAVSELLVHLLSVACLLIVASTLLTPSSMNTISGYVFLLHNYLPFRPDLAKGSYDSATQLFILAAVAATLIYHSSKEVIPLIKNKYVIFDMGEDVPKEYKKEIKRIFEKEPDKLTLFERLSAASRYTGSLDHPFRYGAGSRLGLRTFRSLLSSAKYSVTIGVFLIFVLPLIPKVTATNASTIAFTVTFGSAVRDVIINPLTGA